jgi:hypothetical protein
MANTTIISLRDSIHSMLGREPPSARESQAVDDIRKAMLDLLGDDAQEKQPQLHRRLRHTTDAEGLWYARAELYAHLCQVRNEVVAVERLQSLLPLFEGRIPKSLLKTRRPGSALEPDSVLSLLV